MQLNTPAHISMYLSPAARKLTAMKHVSSNFMIVLTNGVYDTEKNSLEPCVSQSKSSSDIAISTALTYVVLYDSIGHLLFYFT